MRDKGVPEKYIRLVKDMYYHCETIVRLQEQANPLQWKLASAKDPLSALSCLPS